MPIKVLDKKVVDQIAAGEVVERPASVVKELVENSLDAAASQIAVEVRGGGVSLIRVVDNGTGIPAAEVELAFERHATSKVSSLEDLISINTLGFRGEALPSIAAVAQMEILTCADGEPAGTFLSLEDGVVVTEKAQGRPRGTTLTVRNLFRKVPARLKFLKSPSTENSHIASVVSQYALAYPEIAFSLFIEGKPVLRTPGQGKLMASVIELYGLETARNMLEIKDSEWEGSPPQAEPIRVTGMVGAPTLSRSGRDYLSFFINRRWVNSRLLFYAVEEAYHGLLMTGRHPVAILNIALPPSEVDVNIHPAKSEVKLRHEHQVFRAVQKAVRQSLVAQMPVPRIEEVATDYKAPTAFGQSVTGGWQATPPASHAMPPPETPKTLPATLPVLRVLGQLMGNYIVAEGPEGLYLIDQHAAHERVLFDKVRRQRAEQKVEVQGLLSPVSFEVDPRQEVVLKSGGKELAEFGFDLEPFGGRTYLVRAVPQWLHDKAWAAVLRELLDGSAAKASTDWAEKIAASIACHGAVRAGQVLSDDEMRGLVRQLEQTASPHTCPHGRPTMIHLSAGQLRREFGRSS